MSLSLEKAQDMAEVYLLPVGLKISIALVILFFGRMIAKTILRALDRVLERGKVDLSLRKFLGDVTYAVLFVAVVIAALDTVGVKTTAVLAILGAAGLAVGLALQGSLSNFAAGVMLIVLRPYKVGDLVVIGKYLGRVDAIRVFQTVLITDDYREITIPNGSIIGAPIENLTILGKRRVDLVVSVAQDADIARVRSLLESAAKDDRVQQVTIGITEITDAWIKMYVRPWTTADQYAVVANDTMARVKSTMDAAGLKYAVALQAAA